MVIVVGVNDLESIFPESVYIWDYEKNNPHSPKDVGIYFKEKCWWFCNSCLENCSYLEYPLVVYKRFCKGEKTLPCNCSTVYTGINDLFSHKEYNISNTKSAILFSLCRIIKYKIISN